MEGVWRTEKLLKPFRVCNGGVMSFLFPSHHGYAFCVFLIFGRTLTLFVGNASSQFSGLGLEVLVGFVGISLFCCRDSTLVNDV